MCWSAPASLILGATGVGVAAYAHREGESKFVTIPLVYFSLMEFLQFFSYFYIDQCALSGNTMLTFVSFVHIAFQTLFFNMLLFNSNSYVPSLRIRRYVYAICLFCSVLILVKLIPFAPQTMCSVGTLCGKAWCTLSGNWHLAWSVPQYTYPIPGDSLIYYSLASFVVPLFYGAWRGVITFVLPGPVLAYFLASGNLLEWPAIWCFYSVALMFYAIQARILKKELRFW